MKKRRNKGLFSLLKLLVFILVLFVLITASYFSYLYYFKKTLIISPLGKISISKASLISDALLKNQISFNSVEIASDSSYMISLSEGGQVILSSSKEITPQINSLQLILKRLTMEGKRIKKLDFRFEKPVLSFE